MENQFRIGTLADLISIREAALKLFDDKKFNDPSIVKNTDHVDFNDKNFDKVRFVKFYSKALVNL